MHCCIIYCFEYYKIIDDKSSDKSDSVQELYKGHIQRVADLISREFEERDLIKDVNKYINKDNLEFINKHLFLDFNYTNTSTLYFPNDNRTKDEIIRINMHGELNNEDNSMIFGYGDELADEYKEIEKLNDNEYLKNVKSINYLKTDN